MGNPAHPSERSVLLKMEELCQIIEDLQPGVICITETWLDDSVPQLSDIPEGYKIIRKDRTDDFEKKYRKHSGGGVTSYIYQTYRSAREAYCQTLLKIYYGLR